MGSGTLNLSNFLMTSLSMLERHSYFLLDFYLCFRGICEIPMAQHGPGSEVKVPQARLDPWLPLRVY